MAHGSVKVPRVTAAFWAIKIAATTLGETAGDALSMSAGLGYLASTAITGGALALLAALQIGAKSFHPALYWAVIVGTTTAGTNLADFADRSLGIGYAGGSALLAALTLGTLAAWRASLGTISVAGISGGAAERFYWATILFSNTLGTALGDWVSDESGLGFGGAALLFLALLGGVVAMWRARAPAALVFWAAFVLTRPLGATVGDLLTKAPAQGGLALSRAGASAVLLLGMAALIVLTERRRAR